MKNVIIVILTVVLTVVMIIFKLKIYWSKVKKGRKPIWWWYHKIMCEFWYSIEGSGMNYFKHLKVMCNKYHYNLYGEYTKGL